MLWPLSYTPVNWGCPAESLEVQAGVEPTHGGFADRCVPVSPLHRSPVFGGKWTESNLLPQGTAFTARRRHQPVLMTLPVFGYLVAGPGVAPGRRGL